MRRVWVITIAAVCASSLLVLKHAWVSEDAYITFRYVDNAMAGHGLVFNMGERVQAYTHPLWYLLLMLGGLLRADLFYWSIGLGIIFNAATVGWLVRSLAGGRAYYLAALAALVVLFSCSSLTDFQTSGLEGSLNHFLLLMLVMSAAGQAPGRLLRTSIWTGLLLLNRLDMFFIGMPILAYAFLSERGRVRHRMRAMIIGLMPVIAWEVFSIIYYGFVFPNTKYAKLGALPAGAAIRHGLTFLADFATWEPLAAAALVFGVVSLLARGDRLQKSISASVLIYIVYLVTIGGGFMRGRLLLPALFLTVVAASMLLAGRRIPRYGTMILAGLIVAAGTLSYLRAESSPDFIMRGGIANERKFYGRANSLAGRLGGESGHKLVGLGQQLRQASLRRPVATSYDAIGMLGYYAGPRVIVIDELGLADAFIARTPYLPPESQRPGHPRHEIPEEYMRERLDGVVAETWADPGMQDLWKSIRVITRGPFWSSRRLAAMLKVWREYGI